MARDAGPDAHVPRRQRPRRPRDPLPRRTRAGLEIEDEGRAWSFDADGKLFRLASEALRIRLAHLFDPYLAVHTSNLDPLPHQIRAVYGEMLPRQPLRFLLADDPGAGKTIMAGLLIKELIVRGDLKRCLIVAPGSLVEQWQDELAQKFGLEFEIITRDTIEASRSGNPFAEKNLVIARLDQLSRSDEIQAKLEQTDWDSSSSTRRTRCRRTSSATRSRRRSATSSASCSAASRATCC